MKQTVRQKIHKQSGRNTWHLKELYNVPLPRPWPQGPYILLNLLCKGIRLPKSLIIINCYRTVIVFWWIVVDRMEPALSHTLQESTLGVIHNKFITCIAVRTKHMLFRNIITWNDSLESSSAMKQLTKYKMCTEITVRISYLVYNHEWRIKRNRGQGSHYKF